MTFLEPTFDENILPEEIVGSLLHYINNLSYDTLRTDNPEYVLVVPPSFTQAQREALFYASQIANIHVSAFIESNVASAFWFGMERTRTLPSQSKKRYYDLNEPSPEDNTNSQEEKTVSSTSPADLTKEQSFPKRMLSFLRHPIREFKSLISHNETPVPPLKKPQKRDSSSFFATKPKKNGERARHPSETRPVIFVDIGDYQTTFTYAVFTFRREEVDPIEIVKPTFSPFSTPQSSSSSNIKETEIIRTDGVLDIRHVKTVEMLGGFRYDEPLLEASVSALCETIRRKNSSSSFSSPSLSFSQADKEFEDLSTVLVPGTCPAPSRVPSAESIQASALSSLGYRLDDFNITSPYYSYKQVVSSTSHDTLVKQAQEQEAQREECLRLQRRGFQIPPVRQNRPLCNEVLSQPSTIIRLRRAVRHAKEMLAVSQYQRETIDNPLRNFNSLDEFAFVLSQERLANTTEHITQRLRHTASAFVEELKAKEPSVVVSRIPIQLVGGGTRLPFVRQALADGFGVKVKDLEKKLNLDEANGLGSTAFALLSRPCNQRRFDEEIMSKRIVYNGIYR